MPMSGLAYNNQKVQRLRRLIGRRSSRHGEGRFVVEGTLLAEEAVRAGWRGVEQFVPAGGGGAIAGCGEVHELGPGVFERVAPTVAPQPPLVVFEIPERDADRLLRESSLVVVLDRISDPGNLGTVIRSSEAAGVDAVVVTPGSVDPFAPKAVRASAGALFHVPVVTGSLDDVAGTGLRTIGTSSHSDSRPVTAHVDADLTGRCAIVLGSEASGLDSEWLDRVDECVVIEHRGRSESLNLAMAATVLVFEAARQRGAGTGGDRLGG